MFCVWQKTANYGKAPFIVINLRYNLSANIWHKAVWTGHPIRLELNRAGLCVKLANHYTTLSGINGYVHK